MCTSVLMHVYHNMCVDGDQRKACGSQFSPFTMLSSGDETQVRGLVAVPYAIELPHGLNVLSFVLQADLYKKYTQNEMQSSPPHAGSESIFLR